MLASSSSIGANLKLIVIIIANSFAGKPNFLNGFIIVSIPLANARGEVVSVRSLVPRIKSVILVTINIANVIPSSDMVMDPIVQKDSPDIKNMLTIAVNIIIGIIFFNGFKISTIDIFAIKQIDNSPTKIIPYPNHISD